MHIIVKKRIGLGFLGDEYQESYIIVRSIGIIEYENLKGTVRDEVLERFISGEISQDGKMIPITKENFLDLPGEVFVEAFAQMTGNDSKKKIN